jgi:uncharacterized membrane protein
MITNMSEIIKNVIFFAIAILGIGLNLLFCSIDSKNIFVYIFLICGFISVIVMKLLINDKEK